MALLSKKLEEVRERFIAQAGEEQRLVLELGAKLAELDTRISAELDAVLDDLAERRAEIHQKLVTLSHCVGKMPPPAERRPQPLTETDADEPLPDIIARAKRQAAALRAEPNGHYQAFEGASEAGPNPPRPAH